MLACRSLFRVDRLLKLTNTYVKLKPFNCFQGYYSYHSLSLDLRISVAKKKLGTMDKKKRKIGTPVWKPVCTQPSSLEEHAIKDVMVESENGSEMQEVNEVTNATVSPKALEDDIEDGALKEEPVLSDEKHSLSVEIGASLIRFVRGKEGSTKEKIEKEMGVQIILPSSKQEDSIMIEGTSADSVTKASKEIQHIIDENSILGISDACVDDNQEDNSDGDTSEDEAQEQQSGKGPAMAVEVKVSDDKKSVKVDVSSIPFVSYVPKESKSSNLSDLGIEKSIFIKPKTFHLTVLMLKLWNKERVNLAAEVLKSISSKVMDALDNRPIFVRLKGLNCMRGSLARARVVYAPVEEIGSENRLLCACEVIINAFVEAGLVLEKDARHELKLHATVMNARHRKRKGKRGKFDSFDARGIFKQFGSEEWGEYLIREAHLSQRFKFDEYGYYHCCASIPFPENMQVD
ncbi:Eukaryotic LigT isoform 3 [Theobroma cacao]|uniref:Eukaryotic LigT isoform 3 n=1 Tax=Theobroma cacao TaxID=3641 RepID=A0A061GIF9_THECC|nr:Eukaryotic LigT isoform 3 [Theobroma cacao]